MAFPSTGAQFPTPVERPSSSPPPVCPPLSRRNDEEEGFGKLVRRKPEYRHLTENKYKSRAIKEANTDDGEGWPQCSCCGGNW